MQDDSACCKVRTTDENAPCYQAKHTVLRCSFHSATLDLYHVMESIRNNAAYMSGKADTNKDREQFEHIRKEAQTILSKLASPAQIDVRGRGINE